MTFVVGYEAARADVEALLDEVITAMMMSGCDPQQMMVVCRLLVVVREMTPEGYQ